MRKWGEKWLTPITYRANLSDQEVRNITAPAIVAHGFNDVHPEHSARKVYELLPNAVWADFSSRYTEKQIAAFVEDQSPAADCASYSPFCEKFLGEVESGAFTPDKK